MKPGIVPFGARLARRTGLSAAAIGSPCRARTYVRAFIARLSLPMVKTNDGIDIAAR